MPLVCDVSVLLALVHEGHTHHPIAKDWVERVETPGSLWVCRASQMGLLRLLCTRSLMGALVHEGRQAWGVYEGLMEDERFRFIAEPAGVSRVFQRLTGTKSVSPRLIADGYLAAVAEAADAGLVTFDRGFRTLAGARALVLGG